MKLVLISLGFWFSVGMGILVVLLIAFILIASSTIKSHRE